MYIKSTTQLLLASLECSNGKKLRCFYKMFYSDLRQGWEKRLSLSPRSACKPHSVQRGGVPRLGDHLSGTGVSARLVQPTRNSRETSSLPPCGFVPAWLCSRRGLSGCRHCCRHRWSLTPPFHPCRGVADSRPPHPWAVCLCDPIRQVTPPRALPGAALWGVRTFLDGQMLRIHPPRPPG